MNVFRNFCYHRNKLKKAIAAISIKLDYIPALKCRFSLIPSQIFFFLQLHEDAFLPSSKIKEGYEILESLNCHVL